MKYILTYQIRSKYFHFVREMQKEFDNLIDVADFIRNNDIIKFEIYKKLTIN